MPTAGEGLVFLLRLDVVAVVSFELDVYFLVALDVHYFEGCTAFFDHVEDCGVAGVVGVVEGTVVDREAVGPKVKVSFYRWRALGDVGGGIFDDL